MDEQQADIASGPAKLRDTYYARLPLEIAELTELARGLAGATDARQRLHKLAGFGGTFGNAEQSRQARALDDIAQA